MRGGGRLVEGQHGGPDVLPGDPGGREASDHFSEYGARGVVLAGHNSHGPEFNVGLTADYLGAGL